MLCGLQEVGEILLEDDLWGGGGGMVNADHGGVRSGLLVGFAVTLPPPSKEGVEPPTHAPTQGWGPNNRGVPFFQMR